MLEHGVELLTLERELLGFALSQPDRPAGRAAAAGIELGARDVDADDSPVGRQPVEIDAVADGDVEQIETGSGGQVPEHLDCGRGARRRCRTR